MKSPEMWCIFGRSLGAPNGNSRPMEEVFHMRRLCLAFTLAAGIAILASTGLAQHAPTTGPYKVLKTAKVGGDGGWDYISADLEGRRLYVPRSGPTGQLTVFNLCLA